MTSGELAAARPSPKAAKMVQSSRKLLAELVEEALQPLTSLVQDQSARIDELQRETARLRELAEGRTAELGNMVVGLQQRAETETFETGNRITRFYQSLETQFFELSNLINGGLQGRLAEIMNLVASGQQATESKLFELSNLVVGGQQKAETSTFELSNIVVSGQQAAESRAAELSNMVGAVRQAVESRAAELSNMVDSAQQAAESRAAELSNMVGSVQQAVISELSSRLRALSDGKVSDRDGFAGALQTRLAKISDQLTGRGASASDLSQLSERIARGQQAAESTAEQLSGRIERGLQTVEGKIGEIAELVGAAHRSADSRLSDLSNLVARVRLAMETSAFEISNLVLGGQQAAETKAFEISNLVLTGQQTAETRHFELSNQMGDLIRNKAFELDNSIRSVQQSLESKVFELDNALAEVRNHVIAASQLTETRAFESFNLLHDLNNRLTHLLSVVANVKVSLIHEMGERFQHRDIESVQRLLAIEAALRPDRAAAFVRRSVPRADGFEPFEAVLARAQEDFPRQFEDWLQRLKVFGEAVQTTPIGNLANWSDPYSHAFKSFVEARAVGSILDVGCGQFERPIYLSGFPKTLIYGLDPLPAQTEFEFPVARGIGEYLPWEDGSFDTLVSATSIDHTLSLDRALSEMDRVLAPDGRVLMWVGSVPGAKRYDPDAADYAPVDKFHLFHIDRAWFEPMLEERFILADRLVIWTPAHEHVFYMLTKKQRPQQPASTGLELETGAAGA